MFLTYQTFVTNLHLLRVELRCKLQKKLHRVTGPLETITQIKNHKYFSTQQKQQKEVDSRVPSVQAVNESAHELITLDKDPRRKDSPVVSSLDTVNKNWQALSLLLMNTTYKYNEVREQMLKYHKAKKTVMSWFQLIESRLIDLPPFGIDPKSIKKHMTEQQVRIIDCPSLSVEHSE